MKLGIQYNLQKRIPKRPSWVPGSLNMIPAHWEPSLVFRGKTARSRALAERRRLNSFTKFGPGHYRYRVVRVETRVV